MNVHSVTDRVSSALQLPAVVFVAALLALIGGYVLPSLQARARAAAWHLFVATRRSPRMPGLMSMTLVFVLADIPVLFVTLAPWLAFVRGLTQAERAIVIAAFATGFGLVSLVQRRRHQAANK
jgi:hypothetical protein